MTRGRTGWLSGRRRWRGWRGWPVWRDRGDAIGDAVGGSARTDHRFGSRAGRVVAMFEGMAGVGTAVALGSADGVLLTGGGIPVQPGHRAPVRGQQAHLIEISEA